MSVVLVGQNPFVRLFAGDEVTALASMWNVEWSVWGAGRALIVWRGSEARAIGPDERLCRWLTDDFTRLFPEARDLAWDTTAYESGDVRYDLDLERGLVAAAGDITVEIAEPLDRRVFRSDDFPLAGVPHAISNVFVPCRRASVSIGGEAIKGEPKLSGDAARPSSSAFLAVAEVWSTV